MADRQPRLTAARARRLLAAGVTPNELRSVASALEHVADFAEHGGLDEAEPGIALMPSEREAVRRFLNEISFH